MPAALDRLLGGAQQRLHGGLRADRILVARPAVAEVQRPLAQVEHRRERLRRAAVDAQSRSGPPCAAAPSQHGGQLDEGVALHRRHPPGPAGARPDASVAGRVTAVGG